MTDLLTNGFPTLNAYQVCGMVGFLIYIISFAAQQMGHLCGNGFLYPAFKVAAASMVLISLSDAFNLASALIQTSYILIGLVGLGVRLGKEKKLRPISPIEPDVIRT